jgi:plastocyanin
MKGRSMMIKMVAALLAIVMTQASCSSPSEKTAAEAVKPTIHSIEIRQMKFVPSELKVKKGDKIIFINHDLVTHDITEESKKAWSSSPVAADQTWTLVATESVSYFCSIHPVMNGKIIVE